jgi:hypothetical protein
VVRDVLRVRGRLEHAAFHPELALGPLEALEGELVEAAVVELADVGHEADAKRLPALRCRRFSPARLLVVARAAARGERQDGEGEDCDPLHQVGFCLTVKNSDAER